MIDALTTTARTTSRQNPPEQPAADPADADPLDTDPLEAAPLKGPVKFLIERELRAGDQLRRAEPRHHLYWRRMAAFEILLHGGSWTEGTGETLLLQVADSAALQHVLAQDPYVQQGLILRTRIRELENILEAARALRPGPGREAAGAPAGALAVTEPLSAHERRLARMILDGLTNRQIAARLGVSPRAVEQHITRIYRKLAISRRAQLAVALERSAEPVGTGPARAGYRQGA
ncbi:LuxR C-terminal-related transcriptional regulator [Kitasatospora sp. NPDC127059]|uniref:helix-turn-helix transcriptional regulator n=1 Tax=unclassified Kitasatospora TaxID=2633591 RepID=UPI00365B94CA